MKFILTDTFNNVKISAHRSLDAAVKAQRSHSRAVKRANGQSSYIPTAITLSTGEPVDENELLDARLRADAK